MISLADVEVVSMSMVRVTEPNIKQFFEETVTRLSTITKISISKEEDSIVLRDRWVVVDRYG
jgi:hypothetical protein